MTTTFPDNSDYNTESDENVFILELESGNAVALAGQLSLNNKSYNEIYYPHIYNISKEGIFFPFFFANSAITNRAQENILCGIFNNLGPSYSYFPERIKTDCLPKILKNSDYKTIIFRAHKDKDFVNTANFMKELGFEEFHYIDIMKQTDPYYEWGYDDCIFYKRAFEYLRKKYQNASRLFVYFVVSSTHYPFKAHDKYSFIHRFNYSSDYVERYLNSFLEQDYCVTKFYEEFKKDYYKNSHLFILPDSSIPLGLHEGNIDFTTNAFNDHFLIFLSYIPPERKKDKFETGKQISRFYSQTDLIPTIFELLNNITYQNSFAFELIKKGIKGNYEDCHVLNQPSSSNEIAIVKGYDKYIYSFSNNQLTYYNLKLDWFERKPILILNNIKYDQFRNKYYCKRFYQSISE